MIPLNSFARNVFMGNEPLISVGPHEVLRS